MPYLYGLFVEAFRFGTPIMRPMFWHHQNDPRAAAAGDQFLLGRDLLVAPILRQGATARSVYLPTGMWFNFWTGEALRGGRHVLAEADLEELPLYVRAGAIVPMTSVQQYMGEKTERVVNLHVWPGPRGGLHWYEDDGKSFQHEQGGSYERAIELSVRKRTTALHFGVVSGKFRTQVKRWRILLRSATRAVQPKVAEIEIPAVFDSELGCAAFELPNVPEELQIRWR